MKRRGVILKRAVALLSLLLVAHGAAHATAAAGATLRQRLDRALTAQGVSRAATGALVIDLTNGRSVYGLHRSRSLQPASNQKLTVALAAFDRLGAGYRLPTDVFGMGSQSGSVWRGNLVLKGYGDPSLSRGDLRTLATRIRDDGIRRVTGRVYADESFYDLRRTCPGWKPAWYKIESPPLSALVVARAKVGRRTVDDPALAAAGAFKAALEAKGIDVVRASRVGPPAGVAVRLARVRSAMLSRLVTRMNKRSDNFYAEMLLKHLGAQVRDAGTTFDGTRVVRRVLRDRGVPLEGVRLADGSGLSLRDRITAQALAALLISAWSDPAVKTPFVASLPLAGVDGTLEDRMRSGAAHRHVRAKTGTTSSASTLSGYVRGRFVFSILQNGQPIPWWNARLAQDRFAQALAGASG